MAAYIRVSTLDQQDKFSPDMQKDAISKCCERFGWELLPKQYEDSESGKTIDERPGLVELLDDAPAGAFDMVLVYKLDRLSRDVADFFQIRKTFSKLGIAIADTESPTFNSLSSGSLVKDAVMAALAEEENLARAKRTRDGMARAKQDGFHMGRPPQGFKISADGRLEPDELGQKVISMLKFNAAIKAVNLQKDLGIEKYKEVWQLLKNCRQYLGHGKTTNSIR